MERLKPTGAGTGWEIRFSEGNFGHLEASWGEIRAPAEINERNEEKSRPCESAERRKLEVHQGKDLRFFHFYFFISFFYEFLINLPSSGCL